MSLKTVHWTLTNGSGMFHVAESMVKAERALGINAMLFDYAAKDHFESVEDADVHIVHTHFPDAVRPFLKKPLKIVWIGHGSVEHVFHTSIETGQSKGYGAGDSFMLCQYWLQNADAIVTFWPRQQAIWQSLCDKHTVVDYVPMGVEKDFWKPTESAGKFAGTPSLFTAENCHYIKWPFDLFVCWPWVHTEMPLARLHAIYIPTDQHRWYYPFINRNGCSFRAITSSIVFSKESLRNAFCSTDYFIGLVRYGDSNRLSLEASACGARTISYTGNEYVDYWLQEGDQRVMAKQLLDILKGETQPRKDKLPVPDMSETASKMISIYERILC